MKVIKKIGKLILYVLSIPVLYIVVSLLLSLITVNSLKNKSSEKHKVYLSTNGVHLDIVLPLSEVSDELLDGLKVNSESTFLAFGWGDENFYLNTPTWGDLTFKNAFNAAFLDSNTLMHITEIKRQNQNWTTVDLTDEQLRDLNNYILNSFKLDSNGKKVLLNGKGYGYHDNFYEAVGSYSCLKTCNSWANSAFKKSNLKACLWTPFDFGLINKYK